MTRVSPPHHPESAATLLRALLELIVIAIFFVTFIAQPFQIPSESMVPTLKVGDVLLADKQTFAPDGRLDHLLLPAAGVRRGELVIFHNQEANESANGTASPEYLAKRVIGLPGDRIRLHRGRVWINGQQLAESYAFYAPTPFNPFRDEFPSLRETDPNVAPRWWLALRRSVRNGELIVPPASYFVLGDNRNDSEDSRYWGFVPRSAMIGRPLVVYLSAAPENTSSLLHRLHLHVLQ